MSYSVGTLLSDISGVVHGTTTNKIPNVYGIINRAARAVLLDVDPKETQRIVSLGQVFTDVYDYSCPVDLKGDRIVDLIQQANRFPSDVYSQTYAQTFDSQKILGVNNRIYTQWNTGVKSLRIEAPFLNPNVFINQADTLTGNGTWLASGPGTASNLRIDNFNYITGGGALTFDYDSASMNGGPEVYNSTMEPIDLSSAENQSRLFLWVYIPVGASSNVDYVNISFGSARASFWTPGDILTTNDGTGFVDGWNLIGFNWVDAPVEEGTPDSSKISFLDVFIGQKVDTSTTGYKINGFCSNMGTFFNLQYYSKYLFRNPTTNAFQETVADSLDNSIIINLDTESYNLLFNKVAFFVAQTLQGADATYDADYWQTEYSNALAKYKAENPNESIKKSESYYKLPNPGYSRYQSYQFRRG